MENQVTKIGRFIDTNVGTKFLSISNEDLKKQVELSLGQDVVCRMDNTRLWLTGKLSQYAETIPELGGVLVPQLYVRNRNDGRAALQFGIGIFRQVCSNGLVVSIGDSYQARIKHVSGPKANNFLDILPDILAHQIERIKTGEVFDVCYEASQVMVRDPVQVVGNLPIGKKIKDRVIDRIYFGNHYVEDQVNTAWGLYNLVNETTRIASRHEIIALEKDIGLLDHVIALAA